MLSPYLRCLCLVLLLILVTVLPAAGANIAAGSITVRSVPGGATATLDGVYQGQTPLGNDALVIEGIDPGPHHSSSPGSATSTISTRSGSARPSGAISASRSRQPRASRARSRSSPRPPAPICCSTGGTAAGPRSRSAASRPAGTRSCSSAGYVRYEDSVDVQNGVMTYLDPLLTATSAVGFISVVSSPTGAFVYVDGAYRGVTPLTVAATTGSRRIRARPRGLRRLVEHVPGDERSHGPGERVPPAPPGLLERRGSRSRPIRPAPASTWTTSTRGVTTDYGDLEV